MSPVTQDDPAARAATAERAVVHAHVRRVRGLPGTALGVPRADVRAGSLNYWWQAHLLDALLDAERRSPARSRRRLVHRVVRSVPLRNGGWCNDFHDDMAWFALALHRAPGRTARWGHTTLLRHLVGHRDADGLLSWRCSDRFHNVPANGTAAILWARTGDPDAARRVLGWIDDQLTDPATGLVLDGVQADGHVEAAVYTYNQGVVLGALVELAVRDPAGPWRDRAAALTGATARHLTADGVLTGRGGGDGGLFAGITARYLALAARELGLADARDVVLASAAAAWASRTPDGPRFTAQWGSPTPAIGGPDNTADLSVQLSAWLVLEAAATLTATPRVP